MSDLKSPFQLVMVGTDTPQEFTLDQVAVLICGRWADLWGRTDTSTRVEITSMLQNMVIAGRLKPARTERRTYAGTTLIPGVTAGAGTRETYYFTPEVIAPVVVEIEKALSTESEALRKWCGVKAEKAATRPKKSKTQQESPVPAAKVIELLRDHIPTIESQLSNAHTKPLLHAAKAGGRDGWYLSKVVQHFIDIGKLSEDYLIPAAKKVSLLSTGRR